MNIENPYTKRGYITHKNFNSPEDVIKHVEQLINPAWNLFVNKHAIPITNSKIEIQHIRSKPHIQLISDPIPITLKYIGIFKNVIESCNFNFFSGRAIETGIDDEQIFHFHPTLWTNLNISYQAKSGGSNGMNYIYNDDPNGRGNDIFYDIPRGEFMTFKEFQNKSK